jgi:hypothetical protein
MGGWVGGRESRVKDCLQQSKIQNDGLKGDSTMVTKIQESGPRSKQKSRYLSWKIWNKYGKIKSEQYI